MELENKIMDLLKISSSIRKRLQATAGSETCLQTEGASSDGEVESVTDTNEETSTRVNRSMVARHISDAGQMSGRTNVNTGS